MSEPPDLLARVPLFHGLPREELERLAAELYVVVLPAGALLFREGEAGDSFYVVLEGRLEIVGYEGRSAWLFSAESGGGSGAAAGGGVPGSGLRVRRPRIGPAWTRWGADPIRRARVS